MIGPLHPRDVVRVRCLNDQIAVVCNHCSRRGCSRCNGIGLVPKYIESLTMRELLEDLSGLNPENMAWFDSLREGQDSCHRFREMQ